MRTAGGFVLIIIALIFWIVGISSAVSHGFFEDEFAVQLLILGGAISMLAGLVWTPW
jgi:hypothetical protein